MLSLSIPMMKQKMSMFTLAYFDIPGLVNVYRNSELENHHAMKMGQSTISTGQFSIAMLVYQRVS